MEYGRDGGSNNAARPLPFTDLFERVCPYYMAMGMSYDEFWNGDITAVKAYREAYKIRLDNDNTKMWMQGMYVYSAISSMVPVLRPFSKSRKPMDYLQEPFDFYGRKEEAERLRRGKTEKRSKEEVSDAKARTWLEMLVIDWNKKFEERQQEMAQKSNGEEVSENGG